ncbi:MAG TPA: hypothetical protein VI056_13465 [Candidatus Limnocylindria bacterium]
MSGDAGALAVRATTRTTTRVSVDSRVILATSGFVMLAFVVVHMGGNLLAFAGSATFDGYARSLRELGSPLFGAGVVLTLARVVLAAALIAHLAAHVRTLIRPAARIEPTYRPVAPAYVVYSFPIPHATGAIILLFVMFHLAHLTLGATIPAFDSASPYRNLITALRSWPVALAYMAAALAVGGHLVPGVWCGMNSLGLIRPRIEGLARVFAPALAVITALGMASVPAAVLLGII